MKCSNDYVALHIVDGYGLHEHGELRGMFQPTSEDGIQRGGKYDLNAIVVEFINYVNQPVEIKAILYWF